MIGTIGDSLRQRFLDGMSYAAATVNIVTTDGPAGRYGVTVSAMSSVSADTDPPTMLICVNKGSSAAEPIRRNGVFHVNVLREDQAYLSDSFAGRSRAAGGDKFACAEWMVESTGAPRLVDPLVGFDCRIVSIQEVGTHYVFFGAVEHVFLGDVGWPLIYANRAYGTPTLFQTERPSDIGADALRIGTFHTLGPVIVPKVLSYLAAKGETPHMQLIEGDQRTILGYLRTGMIDMALIYDWDLEPPIHKEQLAGLTPHVLLPRCHPFAGRERLTCAELVDLPMILLDAPPSETFFLSLFQTQGLTPTIYYRTRSLEMVRGLVGSGLGYAILVTQIASTTSYGGKELVTVPLAETEPRYITLATRADQQISPQGETFRTACREVLQSADWTYGMASRG